MGFPWDSNGNESDNDYIVGIGMEVGMEVWEWQWSYENGIGNKFPLQLFTVSYEQLFGNT